MKRLNKRSLYESIMKEVSKSVKKNLNEMARPSKQIDLSNYGYAGFLSIDELETYNNILNTIFSPRPVIRFENFVKELARVQNQWQAEADEEYLDEVGWNIYWEDAVGEVFRKHPDIQDKFDNLTSDEYEYLMGYDGIIKEMIDDGVIKTRLHKHPGYHG